MKTTSFALLFSSILIFGLISLATFTFASSNLTIEYMFKYDERCGALKSSMRVNSVLAIVKLVNSNDDDNLMLSIVNDTKSSSLFHLKKFLPKFYMLRLSQNASDLFSKDSSNNSSHSLKNTIIKLAIEFETMKKSVTYNDQQKATSDNNNNRHRHRTLLELVFLNLYFNIKEGKV